MKKILLLIFVFISLNAIAQDTDECKSYYYYCEMTAEGKWGTDYKGFLSMDNKERFIICDENNAPIVFIKIMQIVNHMSKAGWEYVSREAIDGYMHYVLRKKVTKDEDAKLGLNLLTSDEIKKAKK